MVSYYDIRHANCAIRSLQGQLLSDQRLDIHYASPKPGQADLSHGTLVVFNIHSLTENAQLHALFSRYGPVKEIRETPHKSCQRFIEYYDTRHAEEALKQLNKVVFRGKRLKIEISRPGGKRRASLKCSSAFREKSVART